MNSDKYLLKPYDKREYNCAHFAAEVWEDLTGFNLSEILTGFMRKKSERSINISDLRMLKQLEAPASPCLVWLHNKNVSHVGIYNNGRVLHNSEEGVKFELLETLSVGFKKVRFFNV